MAALNGAGATLVKAQVGPTGAALRAATGPQVRGKAASASEGQTVALLPLALPVAPPAPAASPALLLAAADSSASDDDAGDHAQDSDGSPNSDGSGAAAVPTGFLPTAGPSTAGASQPAGSATPLSASAADLAAQMTAKVMTGSSRFQLQLNPLGLGRVDVSVSIGRDRQLTAALSFADPQTARALSAHAGELKTALEQAGFNVPAGGFDFSSKGGGLGANLQGGFTPQGGFGGGSGPSGSRGGVAAFSAGEALAAANVNDSASWAAGGDSRLDIRI